MNCPHCGRPTDPGATFCGNCGQPLTVAPAIPQPAGPVVVPTAAVTSPVFNPDVPVQSVPVLAGIPTVGAVTPPAPQSAVSGQPTAGGFPIQTAVPEATPPLQVAGSPLPLYALQGASSHPGEVRAIIGLILGVIALPGAIIPFLGLALGIAAIVIGSLSYRLKRVLAILALVFGSIGLLLSIIVFIYNVQRLSGNTHLSTTTQTINTPCYNAKLSKDLHLTNSAGSCNMSAINGASAATSTIGYNVNSSSSPSLTEDNFAQQAAQAAQSIVNAGNQGSEIFTITRQQSDTVAGKTAYVIDTKSNKGRSAEIDLVLDNAPNGNNLFVLINIKVGADATLAPLADSLTWK